MARREHGTLHQSSKTETYPTIVSMHYFVWSPALLSGRQVLTVSFTYVDHSNGGEVYARLASW